MKSSTVHFDGEEFRLTRMRKLLHPPIRVTWADRVLGAAMVPVIVVTVLLLLSGLWLCQKVGWNEER